MTSRYQPEAYDTARDRVWSEPSSKPALRQASVTPAFVALEILVLTLVCIGSDAAYHALVYQSFDFANRPIEIQSLAGLGLAMAALNAALLRPYGSYRLMTLASDRLEIFRPFLMWTLVFLFFSAVAFTLKVGGDFSRGSMLSFYSLGLVAIIALRICLRPLLRRAISTGSLQGHKLVIVGDTRHWADAGTQDALSMEGARVLATFHVSEKESGRQIFEQELDGSLRRLVAFARSHEVDKVLLALPWSDEQLVRHVLERVRVLPLPIYLIPDDNIRNLLRKPLTQFGSICGAELQRRPLSDAEQTIKRTFDIVSASAALVALLPLFVVVAILIKLDSRGPIFFRQTRAGFSGRTFKIYKFRTMSTMDDGPVVQQATRGDLRVTRIGRWLRSSSIDEMPQLLNVVFGQMSLVGPRPHALAHDDYYEKAIATYAYRQHVKPGITGWAQVNGFRGETPTIDLMERRVEHDLWYVANWSFWLDVRTLFMTVGALLRHRDIY
ncbi:undecaprenyl-phosphate glucose phosphotransferase [Microvirga pudoricolor]|uniref:undecaprenyl-phosphate glucose phosphotransferase n=1 Tax=Microvirga pudoricolor TaxID=2778729 RepID=UPI00194F8E24|nr:undecaprenyl-phosphate glucose phosphotransferase [Microvirga pudoricolor]MBM6593257.1 undecaprenyl-phosphate glucose phosphotransferase [Microvirga pudoricolor]